MRYVKEINETGKSQIVIDPEKATLKDRGFDIKKLLTFRIETYSALKASADEFSWNLVFKLPHEFLDTMTPEEQGDWCELLAAMKYQIMTNLNQEGELDGQILIDLETQLSKIIAEFGKRTSLFERLVRFVESSVPIQSFSGVGERAQDSEEMTFYRDDVIRLTAVAIFCKMLTPILGTFIESCKKRMDNGYKEIHAYALLKDFLNENCRQLIDKLEFFINRIVQPMLNRLQLTHTFHGFTVIVIGLQIISSMLTRRFVMVDLLKEGGNLMIYVAACSRAASQTQFSSSAGFKQAVKEMFRREDDSSGREEGNISTLEEESRYSARPADYPILIKKAALEYRKRFIVENELNTELINNAELYYQQVHVAITPLNNFLLSLIFGPNMGGAKGVEVLDLQTVTKLIPVLQVYLIQQGFLSLVHGASALMTSQFKTTKCPSDILIASSWQNNHAYRNCEQRFPFMINDLKWDTALKQIVVSLTERVYTYNTAPAIWDELQEDVSNGKEYLAPEALPRDVCTLITNLVANYS